MDVSLGWRGGSGVSDVSWPMMLEPVRVDGLGRHLEEHYGVGVVEVATLDSGVFRVDRRDGSRWVARVFAAKRPLVGVREDAGILRALERAGFPAERCAHPEPVSEFLGQSVLVTGFLEGHGPLRPGRPAAILGALLGACMRTRQRTYDRAGRGITCPSSAGPARRLLARPSYWRTTCPESESASWGCSIAFGTRLRERMIATICPTPSCTRTSSPPTRSPLPTASWLSSIGPARGRGPRLWSIGFLLWAAGTRDLRLVDVVVSRYRRSVELEPAELDRLEGAIRGRPVMLESWSVCAGRRELAAAVDRIERAGELARSVAIEARRSFTTQIGR